MPTVLVIDDDPLVAVSVHDAVPDCTVLEAPDGATGIACIREQRSTIDLVVVDMIMPHDGVLTCLQIRTEAPEIPILPFTGASSTYATAATALGCAPPLFKPAAPESLAAALHQTLGLRPPPLTTDPLLHYLQAGAAASEQAARQERAALLRVGVLASSELLRAGLHSSIAAAGGDVRYATTSATILHSGLRSLQVSLLVADADSQRAAVEVAQSFQLPLLIVAPTIAAAYHAAEVADGVVVEPVALGTLAVALGVVASGRAYRDKLLTTVLAATGLTNAEQAVAHLLVLGLTDTEIARRLVVQLNTVRTHKMHVFRKLGVTTSEALIGTLEMVRLAQQEG